MRGYHPRSLPWASLRLNLAVYRLFRDSGAEAVVEAACDALAAVLRRWSR